MDVLLVTDRCFLPARDGSERVYEAWLSALLGLGARVSVLSFDHCRTRWSAAGLDEARRRVASVDVVPFTRSLAEAAARRLVESAFQIATGRRHLPGSLARPWSAGGQRALHEPTGGRRWDAVVVQKLDTAEMVGTAALRACANRLILDLHDNLPRRQSLTRATVRRAISGRVWPLLRRLRPEEIADALLPIRLESALANEVSLLQAYDDVLFSCHAEQVAYESAGLDPARAREWRWGFDEPLVPVPDAATGPRTDLGFIGGANAFNMEALAYLAKAILPRVEALLGRRPTAVLAGGAAAAMRSMFADRNEVIVEPWIESLAGFYRQAAVMTVPLLSGTGVSIKTIEAARFGSALVSTSVGVRGVEIAAGRDFELADNPDDFAASVARLITDPARREQLGTSAAVAAQARHSLAAFTEQVARLFGIDEPAFDGTSWQQ